MQVIINNLIKFIRNVNVSVNQLFKILLKTTIIIEMALGYIFENNEINGFFLEAKEK